MDKLNEIRQQIAQANIVSTEMCSTLAFRSQVHRSGEMKPVKPIKPIKLLKPINPIKQNPWPTYPGPIPRL